MMLQLKKTSYDVQCRENKVLGLEKPLIVSLLGLYFLCHVLCSLNTYYTEAIKVLEKHMYRAFFKYIFFYSVCTPCQMRKLMIHICAFKG